MKTKIIILIIISFFLFFLAPHITRAAVIINEIAWMGTENSTSDEWIELYSDQQTDLSGWVLEAIDGTPNINLEGSIPANGYFLLERTNDQTVPDIPADQIYAGALGNGGENLKLKHSNGNIIDEISCSEEWFAGDNSTKQTMEKISNGWQTSLNPGGTPRAQNSSGEEPEEKPEEPEEPTDEPEDQPPIADAGNDIAAFTDEEITFDGSKSYDPDGNELIYSWSLGEGILKEGAIVVHKYSYPGTHLVTLTVHDGKYSKEDAITVKIYSKKITINEFLPNPIGKDAGDEENSGEWIEIYNNSDQVIDISGWQLDDEDGGSKPFTFPKNTLIAPRGFLVFSRQVTGLALNNDGDEVRFLLPTGVVFQKIIYGKTPEGQSSARTAEGFIWSVPTPGISNNKPLQSEIISPSSKNMTLYNKSDSGDLTKESQQHYYNLANLEESTETNSKLVLIILTIALVVLVIGIGAVKLKKKLKT